MKYKPPNRVYNIVCLTAVLGFGAFGAYETAIGVFIVYLIMGTIFCIWFFNRNIILTDTTIKVTTGFSSKEINLKDIASLSIQLRSPGFWQLNVPYLLIHTPNNDDKLIKVPYPYLSYRMADVVRIIDFLLLKNNNIQICKDYDLILNQTEMMFRANLKSTFIGGLIGCLIYIILLSIR